jgi:hypothetical protein
MGLHAIRFIRDIVDGKDNVIGREIRPIMEFDAFAQLELDGSVVDPLPLGCQIALLFIGDRIAIDRPVPDRVLQNHAFARRIEVAVNILQLLGEGHAQRVIAFSAMAAPVAAASAIAAIDVLRTVRVLANSFSRWLWAALYFEFLKYHIMILSIAIWLVSSDNDQSVKTPNGGFMPLLEQAIGNQTKYFVCRVTGQRASAAAGFR